MAAQAANLTLEEGIRQLFKMDESAARIQLDALSTCYDGSSSGRNSPVRGGSHETTSQSTGSQRCDSHSPVRNVDQPMKIDVNSYFSVAQSLSENDSTWAPMPHEPAPEPFKQPAARRAPPATTLPPGLELMPQVPDWHGDMHVWQQARLPNMWNVATPPFVPSQFQQAWQMPFSTLPPNMFANPGMALPAQGIGAPGLHNTMTACPPIGARKGKGKGANGGYDNMDGNGNKGGGKKDGGKGSKASKSPTNKKGAGATAGKEAKGEEKSATALCTHLQELRDVPSDRIMIARKINRLGFDSAELLEAHCKQFGRVEKVLVAHSTVKPRKRPTSLRLRPAGLGFVVMVTKAEAELCLAAGLEQVVSGVPASRDDAAIHFHPFEQRMDEEDDGSDEE